MYNKLIKVKFKNSGYLLGNYYISRSLHKVMVYTSDM